MKALYALSVILGGRGLQRNLFTEKSMDIELIREDGRMVIIPKTEEERMFIFAFISALAAFKASEKFGDPVSVRVDRCDEDDKKKMFSFDSSGRRM